MVADARTPKCQGFVYAVDHHDTTSAAGEGNGGRREDAKYVNDHHRADCGCRTPIKLARRISISLSVATFGAAFGTGDCSSRYNF
jgi:hypothetical protein